MNLQAEIDRERGEIRTDGYSMSIGEWMSLYEKEELDIHPEFQRIYRWSPQQKTRLIESILLGIPIPPIFVYQRSDGVWDVIDGLQRLSTIFEFAGVLKDEKGNLLKPLVLHATEYLPSLKGKRWENVDGSEDDDQPVGDEDGCRNEGEEASDDADEKFLTPAQRLLVKRSKIAVSIVLRESGDKVRYELFQRLNTGGSLLSGQEVRNCVAIMVNRDWYQWLRSLSQNVDFIECIALTDKAKEESYDQELVLRFLVFRTLEMEAMKRIDDLNSFLTERLIEMAEDVEYNYEGEKDAFSRTFNLLNAASGSNSFRRYDHQRGRYTGGFLVSGYEAIALGIGYNYQAYSPGSIIEQEKIRKVWNTSEFTGNSGSGIRASTRIASVVPFGRTYFSR